MLSGELGTRQETLSRTLAKLKTSGSIGVKGRVIKILGPIVFEQAFREHLTGLH
jgi:CRP-like cAMP-binding protein